LFDVLGQIAWCTTVVVIIYDAFYFADRILNFLDFLNSVLMDGTIAMH